MADAPDMSTPVTRGELQEELRIFRLELRQELRQEHQQLRQELRQEFRDTFATKVELEMWGGALLARIESGERRLIERMDSLRHELKTDIATEIARAFGAMQEWVAARICAVDDQYKDLPGRVGRLESTVFAPEPR
jgi:hypothetical protein